MRLPLSAVRSLVARKLTPERKLWFSRLRHGELPWQRCMRPPAVRTERSSSGIYDARREQQASLDAVKSVLTSADVEFVELPRVSAFSPILAVSEERAPSAIDALAKNGRGWVIQYVNARGSTVLAGRTRRRRRNAAAIRCRRKWVARNGRDLSTSPNTVTVEFWEVLGEGVSRADGSVHRSGTRRRRQRTPTTMLEYLEPDVWERCQLEGSVLKLPAPHLRSLQEPVDVVYTWVDGAAPAWRNRMIAARSGLGSAPEATSTSESRYASRDELRYSLRSLEYYASWVRHVYIVTDRQVPAWLDTAHPNITVVDHREIFSDSTVLPVFNSHAIESQLHHIEGLSEHYLYLNDDVFFLRPTDPELFFTGSGLARYFPSIVPLDIGVPDARDLPVMSAAKNGRSHMLQSHDRMVTERFKHTPHAQLRSVLHAMEAEAPEIFASVAASRFRSPDDVSIPSSLQHFEAAVRGRSVEGEIQYRFVDLSSEDLALRLSRISRQTDLDVACLNETDLSESARPRVDALVAEFLEERFPVMSSFELAASAEEPRG